MTRKRRRLNGSIGFFFGGAPRPSGAGSTRQAGPRCSSWPRPGCGGRGSCGRSPPLSRVPAFGGRPVLCHAALDPRDVGFSHRRADVRSPREASAQPQHRRRGALVRRRGCRRGGCGPASPGTAACPRRAASPGPRRTTRVRSPSPSSSRPGRRSTSAAAASRRRAGRSSASRRRRNCGGRRSGSPPPRSCSRRSTAARRCQWRLRAGSRFSPPGARSRPPPP